MLLPNRKWRQEAVPAALVVGVVAAGTNGRATGIGGVGAGGWTIRRRRPDGGGRRRPWQR